MTDDVKAAWERARDRHWRFCHAEPCPECEDFEMVDAHIDGEQARQDAAVDAELALVVGHLREAASLFDDPRGDVLTNYADAFESKEHRHE